MIVDLISFSFKNGIPSDANYVIDIRFLNNPFYVDTLRDLTGLDSDVIDFFKKDKGTISFLKELFKWTDFIVKSNKKVSKPKIVIAIGCTGGQHRSPYVVEVLGKYISEGKHTSEISVYHKELKKYNEKVITHG